MKYALSIMLLINTSLVFSQEKVDADMMQKIRQEGMNHSQVPHIAQYLTEVSGPRLTNSPGYKRASNWAVSELKRWGLVNAGLESYGEYGKGWELQKFYAAIKSPYYQPVIAYPLAYSNSTPGPVTAEVIVVRRGDSTWVHKNAALIKGKFVLMTTRDTVLTGSPFDAFATRFSDSTLAKLGETYMFSKELLNSMIKFIKAEYRFKKTLAEAGAVAILQKSEGRDGTTQVDGLYEWSKKMQPGLPQVNLAPEEFLKIMRMTRSGKVEMEIELRTRFFTDDLTGYNVIAEIPGSDPQLKSEVVMLGGHLDSWHSGTGATDNAAGCTVMMEAVRILKALNVQPKRTIRIALWGGEEQALLGSFGYVKKHFGDPATMQLKPEQSKISAYYNLDNGTGKIRGIYLQESEQVRPIFQKWFEPFADLGATALNKSNTGGTDHLSFDAIGIPGFEFIQDPIDYDSRIHHSNMDTYDHLIIDDLKQASVIVAAFVYNTAMRADKLPRKPLPKPGEWLFDMDFLEQ